MKNVLRMKPGEKVRISCSSNEDFACTVMELDDSFVLLHVDSREISDIELPVEITLYQGLPKGDKMELIIQKAVELGVSRIVPVSMKHCVMKLDPKKAPAKVKRWNAISESAAKQSKRMIIPEVTLPLTYKNALAEAKDMDYKLLPYENEAGMEGVRKAFSQMASEVFSDRSVNKKAAIFIGPEGGFDEAEVELAKACGFSSISLGRRILRTETAGLATLAMLVYVLEA